MPTSPRPPHRTLFFKRPWLILLLGLTGFVLYRWIYLTNGPSSPAETFSPKMEKLIKVYPEIQTVRQNRVWFRDGSSIPYDTKKKYASFLDSLNQADVEDHFSQEYPRGPLLTPPAPNQDPGRFRCDALFKKMYGDTPEKVAANLEEIIWCPKLVGQKIRINKRNGAAEQVKKISAELDGDSTLMPYLSRIAGSFVWRKIAGTERNSTHSYGITIDINTTHTHYWQWDCNCSNEDVLLTYKNKIPWKIVEVFEKHGFIWGGKWYHYDTMHFEYRPELL